MVRMQPAHSKGAAAPSRSTAVQLLLQPAAARRSAPAPFCRRTCVLVEARRGGGSSSRGGGSASYPMRPSTPAVTDRIIACIPYLLPFLDTFMYGRYLFYQLPLLRTAIQPILPALALYHSIPFAPLVCFFGVYIGLVNNRSMSRFVRFNAMQAMLLDVLLILPRLVESLLTPPTSGWALTAYMQAQSVLWVAMTAAVVFAMVSCLIGNLGRIPFIADAADRQMP